MILFSHDIPKSKRKKYRNYPGGVKFTAPLTNSKFKHKSLVLPCCVVLKPAHKTHANSAPNLILGSLTVITLYFVVYFGPNPNSWISLFN